MGRLYGGVGGLDEAMKLVPFTPQEITKLKSIGNGRIAEEALAAAGGAEARSLQAPFVKGSQMAAANNRAVQTGLDLDDVVGMGMAAAGNPAGLVVPLAGSGTARSTAGSVMRAAGSLYGSPSGAQLAVDIPAQLALNQERQNQPQNQYYQDNQHTSIIDQSPINNQLMFGCLIS